MLNHNDRAKYAGIWGYKYPDCGERGRSTGQDPYTIETGIAIVTLASWIPVA
jgi:hypothetical protein